MLELYGVYDESLGEWVDVRVFKNETIMKRSFYMQFKDYLWTKSIKVVSLGAFKQQTKELADNPILPMEVIAVSPNPELSCYYMDQIVSEMANELSRGSVEIKEKELESVEK